LKRPLDCGFDVGQALAPSKCASARGTGPGHKVEDTTDHPTAPATALQGANTAANPCLASFARRDAPRAAAAKERRRPVERRPKASVPQRATIDRDRRAAAPTG
jgi:hypothetical protein